MWRTSGVLAALLVLTVACAPRDDRGDGIASAGDPTAGATTTAGGEYDAVRWAQCLREHGITVDDPDPGDPGGKPTIHDELSTKEEIDAAADACRRYNPNWGVTVAPDPEDTERQRQFAQCMREHGFDFADPEPPGGPSTPGTEPGTPTPSGPQFDKAVEECGKRVPGIVATGPGGEK